MALYLEMLGVQPEVVAHDLHPDYPSTRWALDQEAERIGVQHHHAHAAACLAEHGEDGPALALVFDGTGYGTTAPSGAASCCGATWPSSSGSPTSSPCRCRAGEAAIREPWRTAAAYLERAGPAGAVPERGRWCARASRSTRRSPRAWAASSTRSPRCSACREQVTYEGQAAIELEQLAGRDAAAPYACRIEAGVIRGPISSPPLTTTSPPGAPASRSPRPSTRAWRRRRGRRAGSPARTTPWSSRAAASRTCACSSQHGRATRGLGVPGAHPPPVPPNDGGISYGQAARAARRIAPCA